MKLVLTVLPIRLKLIVIQVVLETEVTNTASLKLYERLGFLRSKRLHRYYLNGNTAFRLVLYLKEGTGLKPTYYDDQRHGFEDPPSAGPVPPGLSIL